MRSLRVVDRVPFTKLQEVIRHQDRADSPWTFHVEARFERTLDEACFRAAVLKAVQLHPFARVRVAPGRAWDLTYVWEVTDRPEVEPLRIARCSDDDEVDRIREEFLATPIPLETSPPLRVLLIHHPTWDVVVVNVHHAAIDGMGLWRLCLSMARAYAGRPDPVPKVDPLSVQRKWVPPLASSMAEALAYWRATRRIRRDVCASPIARIAPDGGDGPPGYASHRVVLLREETRSLDRVSSAGLTRNDLLVAALHRAIDQWNARYDQPGGRIVVTVPVDLRPLDLLEELVGCFVGELVVVTTPEVRADPATLLAAVARQTHGKVYNEIATEVRKAAALGLPRVPRWMKEALFPRWSRRLEPAYPTAVLTNISSVPIPPLHLEGEAGHVAELHHRGIAPMPIALQLGALQYDGRLHLFFSYNHLLWSPAAARSFAETYGASLWGLWEKALNQAAV